MWGASLLPSQEEEEEGVQYLHGGGGVLCEEAFTDADGSAGDKVCRQTPPSPCQ